MTEYTIIPAPPGYSALFWVDPGDGVPWFFRVPVIAFHCYVEDDHCRLYPVADRPSGDNTTQGAYHTPDGCVVWNGVLFRSYDLFKVAFREMIAGGDPQIAATTAD